MLTKHLAPLLKTVVVRVVNCATNKEWRKAKEDKRKKKQERWVRLDRGEDVTDEEEEEGEFVDDEDNFT
jgi:hypothetical protein